MTTTTISIQDELPKGMRSRAYYKVRYTSQVTYTNPTNFAEFRCEFRWIGTQQNVCVLSAKHPWSVHGIPCTVIYIVVAKKTIFFKSLIVVAERKSLNDSQNTSHSNTRHLICRSFLAIPRTLCEVSVDASWITMLCCAQIRGLPIWQFRGKSKLFVLFFCVL